MKRTMLTLIALVTGLNGGAVRAQHKYPPVDQYLMPRDAKLAIAGMSPEQIARALEAAYVKGALPKRDAVTFAYMWSAHQHLGSGIGAWHPHMMVFAPYYENAMVGGNAFGSPFPQVSDDAGTPFTVVVIPVDDRLAVK